MLSNAQSTHPIKNGRQSNPSAIAERQIIAVKGDAGNIDSQVFVH